MAMAAPPAAQTASGDQQWELEDLARVQLLPLSPATPPQPTVTTDAGSHHTSPEESTRTPAEPYLGTPATTPQPTVTTDAGSHHTSPEESTRTPAEPYLGTPVLTSPGSLLSSLGNHPSTPLTPRSWLDTGTQTATSQSPTGHETGTQTSVWWSPTRCTRCRIFEPHFKRLDVYPPVPEGYSSFVDTRKARRPGPILSVFPALIKHKLINK